MNPWVVVAATLVFLWGIWDYFHSGRHSSTAFVKALVGLGAVVSSSSGLSSELRITADRRAGQHSRNPTVCKAMSGNRRAIKTILCIAAVALAFLLGYIVRSLGDSSAEVSDGHMVYGTAVSVTDASRAVCIGDADSSVCGDVLNGGLPVEGSSVRGWLVAIPATDTDRRGNPTDVGLGHYDGLTTRRISADRSIAERSTR